jgi:inorganic pyrophosphatase
MPNLMRLPPRAGRGLVHLVVDTPRGSRNKYKFDPDRGLFALSRVLPEGMHFPCDFGSIPGTLGEDGDALDAVVVVDVPSFVGCLMTVRPVGVIAAEQTEKRRTIRNDRLIAVAITPANKSTVRRLGDLPKIKLDELDHFFMNYNRAHGRIFRPIGRLGPAAAERALKHAIHRHDTQRSLRQPQR